MAEAHSHRALWLELGVTVAAPTAVLVFLADDAWLGPFWSLVLALAFPLGHIGFTAIKARKVSPIAVLVAGSVLLTGGIGLLEIDVRWFAWKEAAVPAAMGLATLASWRTPWPAIPTLLAPLLDQDKVDAALEARGEALAHRAALRRATGWLAAAFLVTAGLTFAFARFMVHSPTGTEAFAEELGRYTGWSLLAVGVPSMAMMLVVLNGVLGGLLDRTGLEVDDLLR